MGYKDLCDRMQIKIINAPTTTIPPLNITKHVVSQFNSGKV